MNEIKTSIDITKYSIAKIETNRAFSFFFFFFLLSLTLLTHSFSIIVLVIEMWFNGWELICVAVNISPLAFWWSNSNMKRDGYSNNSNNNSKIDRQKPNKLREKRLRNILNKPRKMLVYSVYLAIDRHLAWMPFAFAVLCKCVFNSCSFM